MALVAYGAPSAYPPTPEANLGGCDVIVRPQPRPLVMIDFGGSVESDVVLTIRVEDGTGDLGIGGERLSLHEGTPHRLQLTSISAEGSGHARAAMSREKEGVTTRLWPPKGTKTLPLEEHDEDHACGPEEKLSVGYEQVGKDLLFNVCLKPIGKKLSFRVHDARAECRCR